MRKTRGIKKAIKKYCTEEIFGLKKRKKIFMFSDRATFI